MFGWIVGMAILVGGVGGWDGFQSKVHQIDWQAPAIDALQRVRSAKPIFAIGTPNAIGKAVVDLYGDDQVAMPRSLVRAVNIVFGRQQRRNLNFTLVAGEKCLTGNPSSLLSNIDPRSCAIAQQRAYPDIKGGRLSEIFIGERKTAAYPASLANQAIPQSKANRDPRPVSGAGDICGPLCMVRGAFGEERGADSRHHRHEAQSGAPSGNPCLLEGEDGTCVGGVRLASSLYEGVSGFAMLLFGFLAPVCLALALPSCKPVQYPWFAASAACLIAGAYCLIATIGHEAWFFWL